MKTSLSILISTMQQILYSSVLRQSPGPIRILVLQVFVILPVDFISLCVELEESFDFVHVILIVQLDVCLELSLGLDALCYQSSTTLLNAGA